ncbi:MAG: hypothetical protein KC582_02895 [Candidatus Magasanikbacteria bacterium]|nr:hypothetical protein [Candidatus Magasanikbacteria bacterium]MCA9391176.1 hypothetical protein [Candidatus Magasanikbacteria bacterium]HPF95508.1 hypothetical protein [bacterium]
MKIQQPITTTRPILDTILTAILGTLIIPLTQFGPLALIQIMLMVFFGWPQTGRGDVVVLLFLPFAIMFSVGWFAALILYHGFIFSRYPRGSKMKKGLVAIFILAALLYVIGSLFLKYKEQVRVNESAMTYEKAYHDIAGTWHVSSVDNEYKLAFSVDTTLDPYTNGFNRYQKLLVTNLTDNLSFDCSYHFAYVSTRYRDTMPYQIGVRCPYLQARELLGDTKIQEGMYAGYENKAKGTWYFKTDSIKNNSITLIPSQSTNEHKTLILKK